MHEIREWWALIVALVAFGVWLVRLEAVTKAALREVERLEKQIDADRMAAQNSRQEQNDMLREMRADIKRLLERR
ncbi:MAG: hypothetical protein Q4G25_13200 [Paracoccus sp. (in: a-proteobacteria)]|nr:hypothetical protein [Paracoccus sp. (in: a-proteobacteria)]